MFLSIACLVALSNLRFLNHAFYSESLKDSRILFSSHWLVLPGVTKSWAGSKAAGRCPWRAASMGVCTLLEFDAPNWAGRLGVGAWFAAAPRAAILACNSAISCCDPVSRSLLMYWMASLFSKECPSWRALCWASRSKSIPRFRIWESISLTKTTWLTSPIVAT